MTIASIIMPTYNKADYLYFTLATFLKQTQDNFEIIIVNDGSDDHTESVVHKYSSLNIKYIYSKNSCRSAARNIAVASARSPIIIFCDDDRLVSPSFVENHVQRLLLSPQSVVLGLKRRVLTIWRRGRLPIEQHEWLAVASRTPGLATRMENREEVQLIKPAALIADFEGAIERILIGDEPDNHLEILAARNHDLTDFHLAWAFATTANMSVWRKHLLGGPAFDESYRGWGLEDTDLAYRLHLKGLRIHFDTSAINYHQVHPLGIGNAHSGARQRAREYNENIKYFCRKFKTLESYLFWRCQGNIDIIMANNLIETAKKSGPIHTELMWAYQNMMLMLDGDAAQSVAGTVVSGQYITALSPDTDPQRRDLKQAA